ncbi:MAG: protein translocase subunit SecF [Candidatus Borkfalkiaceae bacterium]|nr:protein translocase subunit SecF [Christensenellaceae bacterium]
MVNFSFRDKKFRISEKFFLYLAIGLVVIAVGFVFMAIKGMNVGIEFSAGATVEVSVKNIENFDESSFKKDFEGWLQGDRNFDGTVEYKDQYQTSTTQTSRTAGVATFEFRFGTKMKSDGQEIDLSATVDDETSDDYGKTLLMVKAEEVKKEISTAVLAYLQDKYPSAEVTETSEHFEINAHTLDNDVMLYTIRTAFIAIAVAIVAMLVYICFRFTWVAGISAVLTLCFNVLVMVSLTTLFRIPVNSTFIAAVITIIGYSINATIVVFDRVRELDALPSMVNESDETIANKSIADTLSRTILTTLTTLVVIVLLAVFGTNSIKEFAYPIIFGLIAGAYSSVFLAAPIWVYLRKLFRQSGKRSSAKKSLKKKAAAATTNA